MDNLLFSARLKQLRKKAGYKSAEAFAKAYNSLYMSKDSDILPSLKGYENPNTESNPTVSVLANISDMLGCDIDFLVGRSFTFSEEDSLIANRTGLSLAAVKRLRYLSRKAKDSNLIYKEQSELDAVNLLLEDDVYGSSILENISDYINNDYEIFSLSKEVEKHGAIFTDTVESETVLVTHRQRPTPKPALRISVEDIRQGFLLSIIQNLGTLRRKKTASSNHAESGKQGQ